MKAAKVAVPTLITAAVRMPAMMVGAASGKSNVTQYLPRGHPYRRGCTHGCRGGVSDSGIGVPKNGIQGVQKERDQRGNDTDPKERNHERE